MPARSADDVRVELRDRVWLDRVMLASMLGVTAVRSATDGRGR
jgi:hypothetical protein